MATCFLRRLDRLDVQGGLCSGIWCPPAGRWWQPPAFPAQPGDSCLGWASGACLLPLGFPESHVWGAGAGGCALRERGVGRHVFRTQWDTFISHKKWFVLACVRPFSCRNPDAQRSSCVRVVLGLAAARDPWGPPCGRPRSWGGRLSACKSPAFSPGICHLSPGSSGLLTSSHKSVPNLIFLLWPFFSPICARPFSRHVCLSCLPTVCLGLPDRVPSGPE